MISLNINYQNNTSETKEFTCDSVVIGRLKNGVDITINEKKVSRKHTEIFQKDEKWFVKDLASTNGTYLNGRRLEHFTDTSLKNGDYIVIGDSNISVVLEDGEKTVMGDDATVMGDEDKTVMLDSDATVFPDAITDNNIQSSSKYYLECLNGKNKNSAILLNFSKSNQINLAKHLSFDEIEGEILLNFDNTYLILVNLSSVEVKINSEKVVQNQVVLDANIITIGEYKFKLLDNFQGSIVNSNSFEANRASIEKQTTSSSDGKLIMLLGAVIIVILLAILFFVMNNGSTKEVNKVESKKENIVKNEKEESLKAVKVSKVEFKPLNIEISLNGNLKPIKEKNLKSKVNTKIKKLFKNETNNRVKTGDALALLDDSLVKEKLKKANLDLKKAKNDVKKAESNIRSAQTRVRTKSLNSAKSIYQRKLTLFNKGVAPQAEVDNALKAYDNEKEKYDSALSDVQLRKDELKNVELNVKSIESEIDTIKLELKDYTIVSDFDGVVEKVHFKEGEVVSQNSDIFKVIDLTKLLLEVDIPENSISLVKLDSNIEVNVNNKQHSGRLFFISPTADEKSRTFKIKISLDNNQSTLFSGLPANISLKKDSSEEYLVVSDRAINRKDGSEYVYVFKNGSVKRVDIKVVKSYDGKSAINSKDINESTLVVVEGSEGLVDNQKVQLVK